MSETPFERSNFFEPSPGSALLPGEPIPVTRIASRNQASKRKAKSITSQTEQPAVADHEVVTTVTKGQANEALSSVLFGMMLLINFWLFSQFGPVAGTASVLSMGFLVGWRAVR